MIRNRRNRKLKKMNLIRRRDKNKKKRNRELEVKRLLLKVQRLVETRKEIMQMMMILLRNHYKKELLQVDY
jgi:hypothetical protein